MRGRRFESVFSSPLGYELSQSSPVRSVMNLSPLGYELSPLRYELSPLGYELSPLGYELCPLGYELLPR
jgi:hypothetical protein